MWSHTSLRSLCLATAFTAALSSTGAARAGEAEAPAVLDAKVTRSSGGATRLVNDWGKP